MLSLLPASLLTLAASGAAAASDDATNWIDVEVGQSHIFRQSRPISRVLISDESVAQIKLLEEGQFQVRGVQVGATDLWVWYRDDLQHPVNYELTIHRDLSDMIRRVDAMVDGPPPRIYPMQDRLVIEGPVADVGTLEKIAEMAKVYETDEDAPFINLMTVTGDHQVQLRVVFAEVNRTALRELGLNGIFGDNGLGLGIIGPVESGSVGALLPQATNVNGGIIPAPGAGSFRILSTVTGAVDLSAVLSVLDQSSLTKTLAQPTLVALSGQQAEFLAGGEVPIPINNFGNRISIEYKEYGVKLVFVPTVLGDGLVDMRVAVEVSDVDTATAVRLTGIEIPGFISRKTESHLRIESGQTFAMAGMLQESTKSTMARVPLLGDIPVVGALFRYVQHRQTETELMIFVTPSLVRPLAKGEVPPAPGTTENTNPNDLQLFLLGMTSRPGTRTAEPAGPVGLSR